jgi:cysteinyl-tRNA synthetase
MIQKDVSIKMSQPTFNASTHDYELGYIMRMLRHGKAYVINVPTVGNFVCGSHEYFKPRYTPIPNETVKQHLYQEKDFPMWIPCENGMDSPWGKGRPSANLYVACIYNTR